MKRKIILAAAAYLSGLFFASFFNGNIFLFISSVAVVILIMSLKGAVLRDFVIAAVSFIIGVGYFGIYTGLGYDRIIGFNQSEGCFSGEVTDMKFYDGDKASYILKGKINDSVSAKIYLFTNNIDAHYGDIISMDCKFSAFENSYLFNSEDYYKSENIFLSADKPQNISLCRRNSRKLKNLLADYRYKMTDKFKIILGQEYGSFMAGMIFGEKQSLDDNFKTALYRSGIGHILSVSGLHVSIIAAFFMLLLRRIGLSKIFSFGLINILMILLVTIANSPVSAVRAVIMLDFIYSAGLFYRQNDTFNSLAWAVIIICTFNPYSIYSSGFILSFAGTFGIGVFAPYMTKNLERNTVLQKLEYSLVTALCASVFIFPFSMYYFDETSLISPVSNIILVPLCTVSMLTGVVYILTGGLIPVVYASYIFLKPVIYFSEKSADINFLHISKGNQYSVYILFGLFAVCIAVYMIFGRKILIGTVMMSFAVFSVFCTVFSVWRYNNFILSVLGKNSEVSAVICYKGNSYIIDTGDYRSPQYVRKYLDINGISRINNLILTKNVNAQYSAYTSELEYCNPKIITCGDDFSIDGCFSAEYHDGILNVNFNDNKIILSRSDEGMSFSCGNIPSDYDNSLSMNNFEIVVYNDGVYRIRRL